MPRTNFARALFTGRALSSPKASRAPSPNRIPDLPRAFSRRGSTSARTRIPRSPRKPRGPRRAKPAGGGGAKFRAEAEELPNGLRIALIPREGFGRVHARLYSFGGLCALSPRERGAYPLAALCALRDTSEKSFREISEFAENNAISFYSEFSEPSASVCADALPEDLSKAVGLVAGAALDFKIRTETFEAERRAAISDALDDLDDPLTARLHRPAPRVLRQASALLPSRRGGWRA